MPTENRSSNTEQMVSVPRELIDAALAGFPSDSQLGFELRELLAQPPTQHQGEPASWSTDKPEAPGAYWIRGFNLSGEFNEAALVQVARDEDANCLMVNLHQSTTESDTGCWYEVDDINAKFEWSGPLYLHPPTSDGFSAGDMADQGAKAFAARDPEVEELRAQLAEAQEVLRDCIEVGELDAETQWKAERVSKGRRLYVDDRALASIVDPSEPVESDQGIPGTSFQRLNMLANQGE